MHADIPSRAEIEHTLAAGGRVLAVRAADLPGPGPAAAVLRYAV